MIKVICIMVLTLFISACDDVDTPQKVDKDHIWKEQTDMIDQAKGVEQLLQDSAEKQQQFIQDNTQ